MRRSPLSAALLLAATLGLGGCDYWYNSVPSPDDLMHAIPWFDHMIRQRSVHPYSRADVPRYTVEGTIPITGGEADWLPEWSQGKTATADKLVNPIRQPGAPLAPGERRADGPQAPRLPGDLTARGDSAYHTFCSACHGATGAADGPVSPKIGAPSLLTDRARGFSDGYVYSIIRYGRGVMPRYGDKLHDPMERWAVVNYVRTLQAKAPAPAAAVPAAPAARGGKQ